jgi:hypothetical protein
MGGELGAAAGRGRLAIRCEERGGLGYGRLVFLLRGLHVHWRTTGLAGDGSRRR